jgi:hypothetical protein
MDYTAADGTPARGEVWSPGPLPGTVWVLPYSGASASEAVVVHVRKRSEVDDVERAKQRAMSTMRHGLGYAINVNPTRELEVRAAHRQAFNDGRGLPAKDWREALGYDPAAVARGDAAQPLFELDTRDAATADAVA